MQRSYSETIIANCTNCGQSVPMEVWFIVDLDERPDLSECIRQGTLHRVTCPHCGCANEFDAPLLVHDPIRQRLLFTAPRSTSVDQHRELSLGLKARLAETFAQPHPAYLGRMTVTSRGALTELIDADELPQTLSVIHREKRPTVTSELEQDRRQAFEAGTQYERTGELGSLDMACTAWQRLWAHPKFEAAASEFRLAALNNGGGSFLRRYWAKGNLDDLDVALRCWEQVVVASPPGSPNRPSRLTNLGTGLRDRYARTGELADLEQAIEAWEQAVVGTPPGSPDLPALLNNLGAGLRDRYACTGELADLEQAIKAWDQSVAGTQPGSPELPSRLNNLGAGLRDRYARTGELTGLEQAINAWDQSVAGTQPGSPELPSRLNSLGAGLSDRYARTGELVDLEQAIKAFEQAVAETQPGSPDLPAFLNNLGAGLRDRYARTGELADLEQTIEAHEQAVAATPPGAPDLPALLNNLGNGLSTRYARTGELADLEQAIKSYKQAVDATPTGSPGLPMYLNNLGNGLRDRYARTGELADLEQAINAREQALAGTPPGSPDRPARLNNLGVGFSTRYTHTGELTDLEKAIGHYEQAVAGTPPGSPGRPGCLNNLGDGLRDRYARTGELIDLERAIGVYEQSYALMEKSFGISPLVYKLEGQRTGAVRNTRLVEVCLQRAVMGTADDAVFLRRALEVAESTKSRLLSEALGRLELPSPSTVPREISLKEANLLTELSALDTNEFTHHGQLRTPDGADLRRDSTLQRRQQLVALLGGIWQEMLDLGPEANDYVALRRGDPPTWNDLTRLADELGPETLLASFFTTTEQTLLFLWRSGMTEPYTVALDGSELAWSSVYHRFYREVVRDDHTGRRGETWDWPLQHLLERARPYLTDAKRIVFAPEATGHLLPWSVALQHLNWPGALVTLPAMSLLPRLRQRPQDRSGGALVVGDPLSNLKGAELEARQVAMMLGVEPLIGPMATRSAVLAQLSTASIIHLATHAYLNPDSPLDSGILLADGVLTAREVMSHRLSADLLVLSACQTGLGRSLGGDEFAGLSQAFLYAGARSLIASLWSVNDPATAALMTAFYTARQAGVAKDVALRQATDSVRAQSRWSHPYYWGPFVFMGDWR